MALPISEKKMDGRAPVSIYVSALRILHGITRRRENLILIKVLGECLSISTHAASDITCPKMRANRVMALDMAL